MEAVIGGVRVAYQANGQENRPALLLVHGFPLDSGMWDAQLEGLADRAHVIAPDLRGHGRSDVPPPPYSMEQHADDLAGLLDTLGVRKAVVAGLSMGGYVTLAFWRRHPERVAGLALVDTRASADTPEVRDGRTATIERVHERGVEVLAEEMLPRMLTPENLAAERLVGAVREIMLRQPAAGHDCSPGCDARASGRDRHVSGDHRPRDRRGRRARRHHAAGNRGDHGEANPGGAIGADHTHGAHEPHGEPARGQHGAERAAVDREVLGEFFWRGRGPRQGFHPLDPQLLRSRRTCRRHQPRSPCPTDTNASRRTE